MLKKRLLAGLLTAALIVAVFPVGVNAAPMDAMFRVETLQYEAGETISAGTCFDITVSTDAIEAINLLELKIRYDKQLMTPVNGTVEGFLSEWSFATTSINPVGAETGETATYGEIWLTGMSLTDSDAAEGEVISTITFEAKQTITASTSVFVFKAPKAAKADGTVLSCGYQDGGITFSLSTVAPTEISPTTDSIDDPADNITQIGDVADEQQTQQGISPVVWIVIACCTVAAIMAAVLAILMCRKKI